MHHPHTGEESNRCRAEAEDPEPVASPRAQEEEEREHREDEEELTELDAEVEAEESRRQGEASEAEIDEGGREREAVEEPKDEGGPPPAPDGTTREVLDRGVDDREGDGRLDDPRKRTDDPRDGQRKREGVGDRECRDDLEDSQRDPAKGAHGAPSVLVFREDAGEEKRHEEQKMVGTGRNVSQPAEDGGGEAAALRRCPACDVLSAVASGEDDRPGTVAVEDAREPVMLRVGVEEEGIAHAEDVRVV